MGDSLWTQERKLTNRIVDVLKWKQCFSIRFRLEMVTIQTFMYAHISNAVREGSIKVAIDPSSPPHYDYENPTISMPSAEESPGTIVHEATHAAIHAANAGATPSVATHEAASYLAEAVFALNCKMSPQLEHLPWIYDNIFRLAWQVKSYNDNHPSGLFECPLTTVWEIKAGLKASPLNQPFDLVTKRVGLPPSPSTHTLF